jgi:hypothetical protein
LGNDDSVRVLPTSSDLSRKSGEKSVGKNAAFFVLSDPPDLLEKLKKSEYEGGVGGYPPSKTL